MQSYKQWILKTGAIFVVILLVFTFFSASIYTFNLPKVSVDFPTSEILKSEATGTGVVDFVQKEELFSKHEGMITLFAKVGDLVREGRPLFQIKMDTGIIREKLNAVEDALSVLEVNLTAAEMQRTELQQEFLKLSQQISDEMAQFAEVLLDYAVVIGGSSAKIQHQEQNLLHIAALYQAGRSSKKEYDSLKDSIVADEEERTKQKQEQEKFIESTSDAGTDEELQYLFNLDILASFQECHERLAGYQLEQQVLENQREEWTEILANQGAFVVTASQDMVITKVAETLLTGLWAEPNTKVYEAGLIGASFYAEVPMHSNYFRILKSSNFVLSVPSLRILEMEGNITSVFEENGVQIVRIEFFDYKLFGGETVEVKISYTSESYELVLPNQAIHYGAMGAFVLVVDKVETSLGPAYHAREMQVSVLESNQIQTAISVQSNERLTVIVSSDTAIADGDKIRMVDKSEVIETR